MTNLHKPINIYCLIDPRTKQPFYVGATTCPITTRLAGHISETKTYPERTWGEKMRFIGQMLKEGYRPKARLLKIVTLHEVDFYEQFFYSMLKEQGFTLIQQSWSFDYKRKKLTQSKRYQGVWYRKQVAKKYFFPFIW